MIHSSAIAPHLIAIVGGSGSGKSWLGHRLEQYFGTQAARVSLDDFYRDRSHLSERRRARINFDHPASIDWAAFQRWIVTARAGRPAIVPHYDFKTHTRASEARSWTPAPLILVEGLWLLWRAAVRRLFDFSIFVDCPLDVRLQRRQARDLAERGRTRSSVRRQFRQVVTPMHEIYVAPQMRWADMVLEHPIGEADVYRVAVRLTEFLPPAGPWMGASEQSYDANLWRAYSL